MASPLRLELAGGLKPLRFLGNFGRYALICTLWLELDTKLKAVKQKSTMIYLYFKYYLI